MSNQINDLLQDSQAQFRAQRNETKGLVTKWEKTGLLEGISAEYDKHNTAILLENQAKQLISEANTTSTTSAEEWNGVALPLVRRIFGEISAKEFVSVQPMNLPSGLVFWLDFKYGGSAGKGKGRHGLQESIFGANDKKGKVSKINGLYASDGAAAQSPIGQGAGYSLAKTSSLMSAAECLSGGKILVSGMQDIDLDLVGAIYAISASSATVHTSTTTVAGALYTCSAYEAGSGKAVFNLATGAGTNLGDPDVDGIVKVFYYRNVSSALKRGDFEDRNIPEIGTSYGTADTGLNLEIPELEVALEQEALVAKTRKLKVKWSPEFAQDLNAYHSIDAEAELTSMLSEYVAMEIDLEILSMLKTAASSSGFTKTFTPAAPSAGETYQDAFAQLGIVMQAMSNAIHQSTMRGGANFAVCSPEVATYIESIGGYAADTDGTAGNFAMGVTSIGSLKNRWTIYKNPYWTGKEILMGYRGNQFLETGAVYAPYIPLIMTPLVYDPTNFTPRKGVMTRYAKKVVRNDFYGLINFDDSNWSGLGGLPS
tara:strand:- start:395 stop:2014 length:1620 start_codon:yes stop_codon:yes gene_type:complete